METDKGAAEGEEGLMDVRPAFIAHGQAAIAVEPGERAFHDPPMSAQFLAGVDAFAGDAHADVALRQGPATARNVVGLVGMALVWPLAAPTRRGLDRRNGVPDRLEDRRVVTIGARQERGEWESSALDHTMALRARFAAIRGIRADGFAPLLAGMLAESRLARLQSMRSASPNRSRRVRCKASHTRAACQSRNRRQHVTPLPQPISGGSRSQGMPVLSTKMMPVSTARSETRGRPPLGLGDSGGSSGATRAQSSSLTSGFMPQV